MTKAGRAQPIERRSQWFPATTLARAVSRFDIANPISFILMGSVAGLLMGMDGTLGVAGWQWMLVLEAVPAVVIAAINTIVQIGNFLGPVLWGYAASRTGSFQLGLNVIPVILLFPLGLILMIRRSRRRPAALAATTAR